jgi:adenylate kinase
MKTKKQIIVIFGPQGSGKGTQAKILAKDLGIPHISTGDIFREEREKDTERGKLIRSLIDGGNFVPDEITNEMVKDRLREMDCANGAILDGYPRNLAQAGMLDEIWLQSFGGAGQENSVMAILVDVPDEVAMERAVYRRNCKKCGRIYHLKSNPPKQDEICDDCGTPLAWRDDDKEEQIKIRLKTYHQKTEPLIQYYQDKGALVKINGVGTIEEVAKRIKNKVFNS